MQTQTKVKDYMSFVEGILRKHRGELPKESQGVVYNYIVEGNCNPHGIKISSYCHLDKLYEWGIGIYPEFESPKDPEELLTIIPKIIRVAYFEAGAITQNRIRVESTDFKNVSNHFISRHMREKFPDLYLSKNLEQAITQIVQANFL